MQIKAFSIGRVPLSEEFARARVRIPEENFWTCPACHRVHRRGTYNREIEWAVGKYDPGSDKIGDFTWHGDTYEAIVTERVVKTLEAHSCKFRLHDVSMWQDPSLNRDFANARNRMPRVWLPYNGPKVWELELESICHIDPKQRGVQQLSHCMTCGETMFDSSDAEELKILGDTWDGSAIFSTYEFNLMFITESLLKEFEQMKISNWHVFRSAAIIR